MRDATPLSPNVTHLLGCADTVEVKAVFERPLRPTRLGAETAYLLSHFILKTIISARQARDKHREKLMI